MIDDFSLVAACSAVSSRYGDDIGQDVVVTLLQWDQRGTLKVADEQSLKRLALNCGRYALRHKQRTRGFEARTEILTPFLQESHSHLVASESVADRMEMCELRRLLLLTKNQKLVAHALGEKQFSRERYRQKLEPFVEAGYIKAKVSKIRKRRGIR